MTIDRLRTFCLSLPHATEDIKWGSDLVFSVGGKMFVVVWLEPPHSISFRCAPEIFAELIERDGLKPAAYLARHHWVTVEGLSDHVADGELRERIRDSYDLVMAKLPRRVQAAMATSGSEAASARRRGAPTRPASARARR